jgi:hypothetical protein
LASAAFSGYGCRYSPRARRRRAVTPPAKAGAAQGLNWLLIKVPRLAPRLEYVQAEQRLQKTGLTAEKVWDPDSDEKSVPRVLDQQPEAESTAFRGSAVKLTLLRQPVYPLVCRGGGVLGDGHRQSSNTGGDRLLHFDRNLNTKATLDLRPGECSFTDRPIKSNEPDAILASNEDGVELTDALRWPTEVVFVCVINEHQKRFIAVHHEVYGFSDGQWIPKARLDICPNG